MKRQITVALLAAAVLPAVAMAAGVDKYKGTATDDEKTVVKFAVKKNEVVDFTAKDALFKCDRKLANGNKRFRGTPPSFSNMKIDKDQKFRDSYDVKETVKGDENKPKKKQTVVKFKANVDGKFTKKNRNKAKGDMSYSARYVQGPSQGARCDTGDVDWKAKRK